ncbi:PXA domain-containing protein [Thelephora terrestris]|uniref:PXA domain-containing protein n=1 Tax=Thelephora terrestris TaxID=56493 RepID=A0A9P6H887_9AGAM|nr:PXA domain-containing protein [Thelephora terrestris]
MAGSKLPPPAHSVRSFQSSIASKDKGIPSIRSQIAPGTTLAKRLLFPHLAPDVEAPPLLISSNLPPELNAELYDFIALALRAFVNPMWTKISRFDKDFLVQINQVVTQIIQSLEARLSKTDLSPLVFRDLPVLITQHYEDYRLASCKLNTSYSTGGAASLPLLFHQFQPHMAVSADGSINEDYLRQSVDFVLKACLPPEDYDPDTERYVIREIILKVLKDIIPRVSQPWFIHRLALDLLGSSEAAVSLEKPPPDPSKPYISFHATVIFILSAIQAISGFGLTVIHGYKSAIQTIKYVNESSNHTPGEIKSSPPAAQPTASPPTTAEISKRQSDSSSIFSVTSQQRPERGTLQFPDLSRYAEPPLVMVTTVFSLDKRYAASAISSTMDLLASLFAPFLDKLLPYLLYKNVLSPGRLVEICQIAKKNVFPNGYLAPPPIDPTPEEQVVIRERLAARIQEVMPRLLSPLVLGAHISAKEQTIDDILDPLSSAACNIHLLMFILDSVLMTLIPEMGTTTDASMIDGPPSAVTALSRIQPDAGAQRVLKQGSSIAGDNGNGGAEKGTNNSPSLSSATTAMYGHV